MKIFKLITALIITVTFVLGCTHDDYVPANGTGDVGIGESPDELLVKKFSTAPVFDGDIDDIWSEARPLINKATVTGAGDREITLNGSSGGNLSLEPTDLMDPYTGESYSYSLRGGHDGEYLYLLFEWEDDTDSQQRESWFFNPITKQWQQENKYANHKNDKFYEDKFGFMFPIGNPAGFSEGTCTVTCHGGLTDPQPGQKVTRHYMKNDGELTDFWHWKRDRHALAEACDDGYIDYPWKDGVDLSGTAAANARRNDEGAGPYANNQKFTDTDTGMVGPLYVVPGAENYYWIVKSEIGTVAKEVTGIDENGIISYEGGTIDPNGDPAYSQGFGSKRIPSVIINPGGQGNDGRSEVQVKAIHTGSGWQLEIRRLLYTGDPTDAEFKIGESIPFGLAIFNNAAIAHGQTNYLSMKIEN
ncbi:hypothetical protein GCM10023314_09490 [Algibacter agarivorans]|uniref:Cytochrome c-552/DMSO reductase-like haem-binding domain-containing protein n=1 Tax=Algibacter agarivorans TaxID=1109741 RepID=A0ABP9GE59_9FLAO